MKKTWHHTSDPTMGHSITVDDSGLEWVRYALPLTNYSGGSSMLYKLEEIIPQSNLATEIFQVFGESVFENIYAYAQEILKQIQNTKEIKTQGIETESRQHPQTISGNAFSKKELSFGTWKELHQEYLDRFGIMAYESSSGVFQLSEKQSGIPLTQIHGKSLEILAFPFQHLLVVASPQVFRLILGNANPKTILEPLQTTEFETSIATLFPPYEKDNIIHLPIQDLKNEFHVLHISLQGNIVGKTKIESHNAK